MVRNDVAMTTLTKYEPQSKTRPRKPLLIPESSNCLQLELSNGITRELTEVRINRSFVFGLLEDKKSWCLISLNHVLAIKFQTQNLEASAAITWTRKTASELLASLPLPAPATIWLQKESGKKVGLVVLGATRGLIATDNNFWPFVPMQAISYLEISMR
jgi:hypothetical protein